MYMRMTMIAKGRNSSRREANSFINNPFNLIEQ